MKQYKPIQHPIISIFIFYSFYVSVRYGCP